MWIAVESITALRCGKARMPVIARVSWMEVCRRKKLYVVIFKDLFVYLNVRIAERGRRRYRERGEEREGQRDRLSGFHLLVHTSESHNTQHWGTGPGLSQEP